MEVSSDHTFLMYFHSTLRNVGMYTTLSYASLAYSRYYRGKTYNYDIFLILISIAFLIIAATINYLLYSDFNAYIEKNKLHNQSIVKWINIIYVIFGIHSILAVLGVLTALRTITATA